MSSTYLDSDDPLEVPFVVSNNNVFTLHQVSGVCSFSSPDVNSNEVHQFSFTNAGSNLVTYKGSTPIDIAFGDKVRYLCSVTKFVSFGPDKKYETPRGLLVNFTLNYELHPFYFRLLRWRRTYTDTYTAEPDSQGQLHWVEGR